MRFIVSEVPLYALAARHETETMPGSVESEYPDLTQCMNQMVFESQLPHKIVNLLFTISNSKQ